MTQSTQLRFRLAATYVAFIAILLSALGLFFWQHLKHEAELNARTLVEADWGATIGFLHFDNQRPEWVYNRNDPDEAYTVERLRHVYLLADPEGNVLEKSTIFESLQATPRRRGPPWDNPAYSIVRDKSDVPYLIRAGLTRDDHDSRYFLAIGRSLAGPYRSVDRFVEVYALLVIAILLLTSLFSWWLTGVAIHRSQQAT